MNQPKIVLEIPRSIVSRVSRFVNEFHMYDTHYAIPVYDDIGELVRYNVFKARILVRHAKDGKLICMIF